MEKAEVYIMLRNFDSNTISFFRNKYLKKFIPRDKIFEFYDRDKEMRFVTESIDDMFCYLYDNKNCNYRFYFKNKANKNITTGMIFFNVDNSLMLGLGFDYGVDDDVIFKFQDRLKSDFDTDLSMILYAAYPPSSADEFEQMLNDLPD